MKWQLRTSQSLFGLIVQVNVLIRSQFLNQVRYHTNQAIEACVLSAAFDVEEFNSFAFNDQDRCWFHFGPSATTAVGCFWIRCSTFIGACTKTKGNIYKRNEDSVANLNGFTNYSLNLNHIFEFFKNSVEILLQYCIVHGLTS